MKIYVASSWRNPWQPGVVRLLREAGHEVYDYREPSPGESGFSWKEIDEGWQNWTPERYRAALAHPVAEHGFRRDVDALEACDACVLVLPCGRSAHLELGWAAGRGKHTAVLFPEGIEAQVLEDEWRGHTLDERPCPPCGDLDGCHLPGPHSHIEPELMNKLADRVLLGANELIDWIQFLFPRGHMLYEPGVGWRSRAELARELCGEQAAGSGEIISDDTARLGGRRGYQIVCIPEELVHIGCEHDKRVKR